MSASPQYPANRRVFRPRSESPASAWFPASNCACHHRPRHHYRLPASSAFHPRFPHSPIARDRAKTILIIRLILSTPQKCFHTPAYLIFRISGQAPVLIIPIKPDLFSFFFVYKFVVAIDRAICMAKVNPDLTASVIIRIAKTIIDRSIGV